MALPGSVRAAPDSSFDYLYIEANEGGSSGGHVGLRVGHHVYHFQNKDGPLVLFRDPVDEFLYSYALLSNRTIHSTRVSIAPEAEAAIRQEFALRHRAQEAQETVLAALERDCTLLKELLDFAPTFPPIRVPGLGYFDGPESDEAPSTTIVSLRERLAAIHGPAFVADLQAQASQSLEHLVFSDPTSWSATPPVSTTEYPPFAEPWSKRVETVAAQLAVLDILARGAALDRTGLRAPEGSEFWLDDGERAGIARYRELLMSQLVGTFGSRRTGWGRVALISMARLAALDESLATGRVLVLDSLPEDGDQLDRATVKRRPEVLAEMQSETREEFSAARRLISRAERPSELVFERYEERINRHDELRRALSDGTPVRLGKGHLIPARPALFVLEPVDTPARPELEASLARARERQRQYARRLEEFYGYELITKNCVSELFKTLNDSFGNSREDAEAALGGWVDGQGRLGFIPFISASQVDERFRVVAREVIPSYRSMRVSEMRRDSGLLATLRESNTLTSKAYRRADRDSFFVFFTDDALVMRPLLGAINLGSAVGETVLGIVKLPFDRGRTLVSGLRGTFSSLPELAFGNIRKGSNDWIPPELRIPKSEPVRAGQLAPNH